MANPHSRQRPPTEERRGVTLINCSVVACSTPLPPGFKTLFISTRLLILIFLDMNHGHQVFLVNELTKVIDIPR